MTTGHGHRVEGYVDVIAMTSAGFAEIVAPLGTALTPDQCRLLWKMAEEPILCFDGDRAGRKAAYRAIDMALPLIGPGRSLRFALLPEGQDPDDLAAPAARRRWPKRSHRRAAGRSDLVRETEAQHARNAGTARRPRAAACGDIAQEIGDETLRRYYRRRFQGSALRLVRPASREARPAARRDTGAGRPGRLAARGVRRRMGPRRGQARAPPAASASLPNRLVPAQRASMLPRARPDSAAVAQSSGPARTPPRGDRRA